MASPETQTHFVDIGYLGSILLIYLASAFTVCGGGWCHSPHRFCTAFLCVCLSATASPPEPLVLVLKLVDRALVYLLVLVLSAGMLWRQHQSEKFSEQYAARMGLAEFTLITLVPFILGLVVAPLTPRQSIAVLSLPAR